MKTCLICGKKTARHVVTDVTWKYKNHERVQKNVPEMTCSNCGESIIDDSFQSEVTRFLKAFHNSVDRK